MKNIVLKLAMICLFSGCYALFVAWENGGFSQLHDFQAIERNGMSAYLHQTSAATMQAEKNELSILQNNQNSLASCVGIEALCEHAKPGIWVEHAQFLQHKDTGKFWYFRWTIWKTMTPQKPYTTAILHRSYPKQTERKRGITPGVHF